MREKNKETGFVKPFGITLGIALLLSLSVMLIGAWLVSSGTFSPDAMPVIAAVACFAGAFVAGMGAVAFFKKRALIIGLSAGLAYFLLVFCAGALAYFRALPASPVFGMLLAALLGGAAAGIFRSRKKSH